MKVPDLSDLRSWYEEEHGLELQDGIESLRDQQMEAVEWAASRSEPYLLINAPTGAGKTLINTTLGCLLPGAWTYAVHTIRLQDQVANIFHNLPVFTGRGNHPGLIAQQCLSLSSLIRLGIREQGFIHEQQRVVDDAVRHIQGAILLLDV